MFTIENFVNGLKRFIPNVQLSKNEVKLFSTITDGVSNDEQNIFFGEIPRKEIKAIIDDIANVANFSKDYMLYKKTSFEAPIKLQNQMRFSPYRLFDRNKNFQVMEHNYEFEISKASSQYIVSLMCFSSKHPEIDWDLPLIRPYLRNRGDGNLTTLEELCDLFRIITVKIITQLECELYEYKEMLESYLFNISYISNNVFGVADLSEERSPLRRNIKRGGQLFPYRSYKAELVKYYYQGFSTDIPFTQYLAFYHVAEFFFQTISEKDAFYEIENYITRPSFSPHNEEDIKNFYKKIKKKIRDQRDDGVWDEKTGLLLCLKKFIPDIDVLKDTINAINPSAINYYKNNNVPFADEGKIIDFDNPLDETYVAIRNRIYSVRNAIVHSKDGEKSRYEPFKHDKSLSKEIPLIRAVAEEIIINEAESITIKHN